MRPYDARERARQLLSARIQGDDRALRRLLDEYVPPGPASIASAVARQVPVIVKPANGHPGHRAVLRESALAARRSIVDYAKTTGQEPVTVAATTLAIPGHGVDMSAAATMVALATAQGDAGLEAALDGCRGVYGPLVPATWLVIGGLTVRAVSIIDPVTAVERLIHEGASVTLTAAELDGLPPNQRLEAAWLQDPG